MSEQTDRSTGPLDNIPESYWRIQHGALRAERDMLSDKFLACQGDNENMLEDMRKLMQERDSLSRQVRKLMDDYNETEAELKEFRKERDSLLKECGILRSGAARSFGIAKDCIEILDKAGMGKGANTLWSMVKEICVKFDQANKERDSLAAQLAEVNGNLVASEAEREDLSNDRIALIEQLAEAKATKCQCKFEGGSLITCCTVHASAIEKITRESDSKFFDVQQQLADAKRQNAELSAAIAVKNRSLTELLDLLSFGQGSSRKENKAREALAMKPADCLAPVREALKQIASGKHKGSNAASALAALRSIGEEPAK